MFKSRRILEILKGITFGISIIGFITGVVTNKYPFNQVTTIIIVSALASLYIFFAIFGEKQLKSHHVMGEGSLEEVFFFQKWYSKNGELKIFCDDLKWLADKDEILTVLQKKGTALHLYLRKLERKDDVELLFNSGAYLYLVKDEIKSDHRFSLLNDYGIKSVIIRNKQAEKTTKIEFEEYIDHPVLFDLAVDMLADCYGKVYHRYTHSFQQIMDDSNR